MKTKFFNSKSKQCCILVLSLFLCVISYGQEIKNATYRFENPNMVVNISDYEKALSTSDMTSFRFADKSNVIEFKSGLKIELFSANTLQGKGVSVDMSKILTSEPSNKGAYVFDISSDAKYILQRFTKSNIKRGDDKY